MENEEKEESRWSEMENSVQSASVSDTDGFTSVDEDGKAMKKKKTKKKKRKKHRHRKGEESDNEGDGEKKKSKKKKKKKKHKKRKRNTESETDISEDDSNVKDSSTDFDSEGPEIKKRAPRTVKRSGLKTDPSEWSREDLLEKVGKFGTFKVDRKSGSASLVIEGKKVLDETMKVLKELFNRNTEMQSITIMKCFLVDDTFASIMEHGIMKQRHLKSLNISGNALTKISMRLIYEHFGSREDRHLEDLDCRDNILSAIDIRDVYESLPRLRALNGINLWEARTKMELDLSGKKLKVAEVSVVCCLCRESSVIKKINLSMNHVDSDSLHVLANLLTSSEDVTALNLSLNPLTNNGEDTSGAKALAKALQLNSDLVDIDVLGGKIPAQIEENIYRSVMVNRSVKGSQNPKAFEDYLDKRYKDTAPPPPQYHLDGWMPSLQVDPAFLHSRQNAARNRTVEAHNDRIILPRR